MPEGVMLDFRQDGTESCHGTTPQCTTFVKAIQRFVMPDGVMHDFRQDEYRGLSCQAVLCMTFVKEPENQAYRN